jgi:hypothetical protein
LVRGVVYARLGAIPDDVLDRPVTAEVSRVCRRAECVECDFHVALVAHDFERD